MEFVESLNVNCLILGGAGGREKKLEQGFLLRRGLLKYTGANWPSTTSRDLRCRCYIQGVKIVYRFLKYYEFHCINGHDVAVLNRV